jgi:DNA mismatch repair protein MutS2
MEAREEVEQAIDQVRSARTTEELEEAERAARRRVEEAARRQKERRPERSAGREGVPALAVGLRVRMAATGVKGTVAELREGRAVLETSGLRMEVDAGELEPLDAQGRSSPTSDEAGSRRGSGEDSRAPSWSGTVPDPTHEVDLRGLRVDEVELELGRALDAAILGELAELRIIHGKGTGAVRARVEELLRRDRRVQEFRLGQRGEGGSGVTVARVR